MKTRDEITPVPRPEKERHELYAAVLAQTALRTVHELFAADTDGVVRSVSLNGHVATIDRATGREVHPCLITLQAGREEFGELVLTQVDRTHLGPGLPPTGSVPGATPRFSSGCPKCTPGPGSRRWL
ncbi:hypothetical protein ACFYYS_27180 [Streptomyces sp. NPDC002120]|uniref:hypothetical protein n=1 Tax=Streptomyces sp. NPDC002120 TaxID=3364631 RepID=UPI00368EAD53